MDRPCARTGGPEETPAAADPVRVAGPWAHMAPPTVTPAWIGCDGFSGFVAYDGGDGHIYIVFRALEFLAVARRHTTESWSIFRSPPK